jgi:hypothetical protein
MIDTRNHYRAVPVKNKEYWRVQYRRWFWPFWGEVDWAHSLERAHAKAVTHANGDSREIVNFGRLPV